MKKIHFEVHTDGFYGDYWKCKTDSFCFFGKHVKDDASNWFSKLCEICVSIRKKTSKGMP